MCVICGWLYFSCRRYENAVTHIARALIYGGLTAPSAPQTLTSNLKEPENDVHTICRRTQTGRADRKTSCRVGETWWQHQVAGVNAGRHGRRVSATRTRI